MSKSLKTSILYGSLWGFLEATLGYILHWIFFPISGMIMFPIGVYFMKRAEKENDDKNSIIYVSLIAALIKSVNLFMINPTIFKAMNPILMILAQGLLVYVLLNKETNINLLKIFTSSFVWRAGFILLLLVEFKNPNVIYYLKGGAFRFINFVFINAIINTGVIYMINKFAIKNKIKINPNYGFIALFLAIGIQFII
jgi:hypothetical protein